MLRSIIKKIFCISSFTTIFHYLEANDKLHQDKMGLITYYIGMDIAKTCVGWYKKTGLAYEINCSIDFTPILLDIDYGLGEIKRYGSNNQDSFTYSYGRYFRIGLAYNFLTFTFDRNQFFIGLRYSKSFFDFQIKNNKLQCDHPEIYSCSLQCKESPIDLQNRKDYTKVHWFEVVYGGKVSMISIVYIGCTIRYKFSKKIENNLSIYPFDIPGFGLTEFDHAFGYSLYILFRIPLYKSKNSFYTNV